MTYTLDDDTAGTADHNRRAALVAELEQPGDVTTAARDAAAAILDDCRQTRAVLYELAELATVPLYREEQRAARRLEQLEKKAGRAPAHLRQATTDLLEKERAELAGIRRALELAREHNQTRRAILAKAGGIPGDGWSPGKVPSIND